MTDSPYLLMPPVAAPRLPDPPPRVSFCIPTKNRERTIGACLESIRAQAYPDIEIVVVDNGSADNTVAIAEQYADVVEHCDGALGAVRQHSIECSSGSILALFDDDIVIPHADWLAGAVAAFSVDPAISTVWPVLVPPPGSPWVTRSYLSHTEAIFVARRTRTSAVFGGGNSLFRRDVVEYVGGFDPRIGFGEDFDLASKLKLAGYKVILHEDPLIHDTMYSLREIRRKQRWGAEAVATHGTALFAQSTRDALHEQIFVGIKAMMVGLFVNRQLWWSAFPIVLSVKLVPYGVALLKRGMAHFRPAQDQVKLG
jgi:glycosyltransferase involved in cell wall biosynthesis